VIWDTVSDPLRGFVMHATCVAGESSKSMRRYLELGISLVLFAQAGVLHAAESWQKLQHPTASQVAATWQSPPPEYGPEPYYGLNGPVTLEQVERDLDTMKRLGFQAVTVQAGYNMPFEYLSPQYFAFFQKFVEEAKRRNMRVWIVDDAGYPSGFAGGRFSSKAPNLRMQALEVVQWIPVAGGTAIHQALGPDVVSAAAVDAEGHAIPVALHGSEIDWTAPPGQWTVLIVDHEFRTSPTRSDTNPHRVKDTTQSLEDYLSPEATEQYLAWTHEQYKHYLGDEFGKTIMGFRGDEPDFSISGLPWTPAFFARFRAIKGYDVQPYAALFAQTPSRQHTGVSIQLTPEQLRIKGDYYDVFSQMFAAGFFKPQGDWCAANNLEYQVHLNHEEMEMELTHSEGSFFRDMRYVQVPGIDTIWHQIWTDTISDFPRLASSVSHVYGKPRAFTESFAAYRPVPDVAMARYILNEQFVRGVNLVEMMYFPATSTGPKPPPSFMGEAGFSDLTAYVRRMSYLIAMGRPDAQVALYLPSSSMWLGDDAADTQFVSTERLLSEHQIDFDIVDDDELAHDLSAGRGSFETLSGSRYRAVILPKPELLSEAAFGRLRAFARSGGKVVFLGGTPRWIAGRTIRDAREAIPADFRWATVIDAQLPVTPTPGQFPPSAPPEAQAVAPEILRAIDAATAATIHTSVPATALRVMKRRWSDADMYLLFNEGAEPLDATVTLSSAPGIAQLWDPQTGSVSALATQGTKGSQAVAVRFAPYATHVVVIRAASAGSKTR
jgi:hypothetical protein